MIAFLGLCDTCPRRHSTATAECCMGEYKGTENIPSNVGPVRLEAAMNRRERRREAALRRKSFAKRYR